MLPSLFLAISFACVTAVSMGGCASRPDKAQRERSEAIDRQIEEDSRQFKKECKILLLGAYSLCLVRSVLEG